MAKKIIELKNICKAYGDNMVVDNFNFYVNKGEFVTFLGPSGCGKTTTLRMIAGFELPTSGQIMLDGKDITNLPPHKRPINTVFQRYALFPHLDVYDNVAFGLKLKRIPNEKKPGKLRKYTSAEIDEKVTNALKIVDLEEFEERDISTLSGGQQQRVAIARAIVNEPEIILLDEPLGALDLKMRKDMQLELKEMHKKLGITFIYVTHDQEEALTMSDTIVVMKDGVIQQIGRPLDIYNEPNNAFVADFIGESNIYNGTIIADDKVRFLGHVFTCVDHFEKNERVDVVIRPEDVKIVSEEEGMVCGKLVSKIFKGVHYEYVMMVGKNEVLIQDTRDFPIKQNIGIVIEPDLIHIMKKEYTYNEFIGYINKHNQVVISEGAFDCDVTQLIKNSHVDEEGYLVDEKGTQMDLNDKDVIVNVDFDSIEITDNDEDGTVYGTIISSIYKGDHYQIIVRSDDEEEDFIVDTEYNYNENERVGLIIPKEKIRIRFKPEGKGHDNEEK